MDLTIDNEIHPKTQTNNIVGDFVKELQNSLERENCRTTNLYKEILTEMPLASRYENHLNSIIEEVMDDLSYKYDFLYFDYDKKEKSYFLDGYSEGNITRAELSIDDVKDMQLKEGTFWKFHNEDYIVEAEHLKDNIKINVESELEILDFENKKKVGKYE